MTNFPIITAGEISKSQKGEILLIPNQSLYSSNSKTIHLSLRVQAFKHTVYEQSLKRNSCKPTIHMLFPLIRVTLSYIGSIILLQRFLLVLQSPSHIISKRQHSLLSLEGLQEIRIVLPFLNSNDEISQ